MNTRTVFYSIYQVNFTLCCKYKGLNIHFLSSVFLWRMPKLWEIKTFPFFLCCLLSLAFWWGLSRVSLCPCYIFKKYWLPCTIFYFIFMHDINCQIIIVAVPLKHCGASSQTFYLISKTYGSSCIMIFFQNVITFFFWLHMFGLVISLRDVK